MSAQRKMHSRVGAVPTFRGVTSAVSTGDQLPGLTYSRRTVRAGASARVAGNLLYGFKLAPGARVVLTLDRESLFDAQNPADRPMEIRPFDPYLPLVSIPKSARKLRIHAVGGAIVVLYANLTTRELMTPYVTADRMSVETTDGSLELIIHKYEIAEVNQI